MKEVAAQYQNSAEVQVIFEDFGRKLGTFIALWIKKFGAEVLVLGGNVSGAFHLFSKHLYETLELANVNIEFKVSELKEEAALIGSARLLDEPYFLKLKENLPTK